MSEPFDKYQKAGLQYSRPQIPAQRPEPTFYEELASLLNRYSKENGSGTPDFVLADYLVGCLDVFDRTISGRAQYRSEPVDLPAMRTKPENAVPLTIIDNHGYKNEIGEAKLEVQPGQIGRYGPITEVIPVFSGIVPGLFPTGPVAQADKDERQDSER